MFIVTVVANVLLAALLSASALRKLSHAPGVVRGYAAVGVPEERLDLLAVILLAGALGLVTGLAWAPIGVTAGSCVVAYFLLAVGAHLRVRDLRHLATPVAVAMFAAACLALRIATLG